MARKRFTAEQIIMKLREAEVGLARGKSVRQAAKPTFANAQMLSEGVFTTPQGNVVQTTYADLAGQLPPDALSLEKASEPRFDLRTADSAGILGPDPCVP